jgi:hypothetical protein
MNEYPLISTNIGMGQGYFRRLNPFPPDLSVYLFVYVMTLTGAHSI